MIYSSIYYVITCCMRDISIAILIHVHYRAPGRARRRPAAVRIHVDGSERDAHGHANLNFSNAWQLYHDIAPLHPSTNAYVYVHACASPGHS